MWIETAECMGAGTCEQIAPDVFVGNGDGTWVAKEDARHFGTTVLFDGSADTPGRRARVPHHLIDEVVDAAEMCPAECIHVEV